jgi:hypothetical protein
MPACSLSLRRDSRLVHLVRRREISKENNARAHDDRYHKRPNEIFFPGWPKCKLGHVIRVYRLCAFNQRVSIFVDCANKGKGCSITPPKEKTLGKRCRLHLQKRTRHTVSAAGAKWGDYDEQTLALADLAPMPLLSATRINLASRPKKKIPSKEKDSKRAALNEANIIQIKRRVPCQMTSFQIHQERLASGTIRACCGKGGWAWESPQSLSSAWAPAVVEPPAGVPSNKARRNPYAIIRVS